MSLFKIIKNKIIDWLLYESSMNELPLCDFERIQYELKPGDVILTAGRSRVSEIISLVTQSPWTHAALYIGRLHDIESERLRTRVTEFYAAKPGERMLIESMLGKGTIISPLSFYEGGHIRICRPKGISMHDAQNVVCYAICHLGCAYGIRHNLDLARLMFPWRIFPRKFRSTLFERNAHNATHKEICSSMLAEAFHSVRFPILPIIKHCQTNGVEFYQRNPKLYTPRDFDYSPYFEIIKYPMFEVEQHALYRNLPWNEKIVANNYQEIISAYNYQTAHQTETENLKKTPSKTPETASNFKQAHKNSDHSADSK